MNHTIIESFLNEDLKGLDENYYSKNYLNILEFYTDDIGGTGYNYYDAVKLISFEIDKLKHDKEYILKHFDKYSDFEKYHILLDDLYGVIENFQRELRYLKAKYHLRGFTKKGLKTDGIKVTISSSLKWNRKEDSLKIFLTELKEKRLISNDNIEEIIKDHFSPNNKEREVEPIIWIHKKKTLAYLIKSLIKANLINVGSIWKDTKVHFTWNYEVPKRLASACDKGVLRDDEVLIDSIIKTIS